MKIKIGPYKDWFGPYQLAQKLMFWVPEEKDEHGFPKTADRVHKFGEWLAHGSIEPEPEVGKIYSMWEDRPKTWVYNLLLWIDSKKERKVKIHIDRWDTWSMDHTLALIIIPMLEQLRDTKHGSPMVDDEDVPQHLRGTTWHDYDSQLAFDFYKEGNDEDLVHKRWEWVLNEIIWTFKEHIDDGADNKFWEDVAEESWKMEYTEAGTYKLLSNADRSKCDHEGLQAWTEKKQNGFRLFGKYYTALWD